MHYYNSIETAETMAPLDHAKIKPDLKSGLDSTATPGGLNEFTKSNSADSLFRTSSTSNNTRQLASVIANDSSPLQNNAIGDLSQTKAIPQYDGPDRYDTNYDDETDPPSVVKSEFDNSPQMQTSSFLNTRSNDVVHKSPELPPVPIVIPLSNQKDEEDGEEPKPVIRIRDKPRAGFSLTSYLDKYYDDSDDSDNSNQNQFSNFRKDTSGPSSNLQGQENTNFTSTSNTNSIHSSNTNEVHPDYGTSTARKSRPDSTAERSLKVGNSTTLGSNEHLESSDISENSEHDINDVNYDDDDDIEIIDTLRVTPGSTHVPHSSSWASKDSPNPDFIEDSSMSTCQPGSHNAAVGADESSPLWSQSPNIAKPNTLPNTSPFLKHINSGNSFSSPSAFSGNKRYGDNELVPSTSNPTTATFNGNNIDETTFAPSNQVSSHSPGLYTNQYGDSLEGAGTENRGCESMPVSRSFVGADLPSNASNFDKDQTVSLVSDSNDVTDFSTRNTGKDSSPAGFSALGADQAPGIENKNTETCFDNENHSKPVYPLSSATTDKSCQLPFTSSHSSYKADESSNQESQNLQKQGFSVDTSNLSSVNDNDQKESPVTSEQNALLREINGIISNSANPSDSKFSQGGKVEGLENLGNNHELGLDKKSSNNDSEKYDQGFTKLVGSPNVPSTPTSTTDQTPETPRIYKDSPLSKSRPVSQILSFDADIVQTRPLSPSKVRGSGGPTNPNGLGNVHKRLASLDETRVSTSQDITSSPVSSNPSRATSFAQNEKPDAAASPMSLRTHSRNPSLGAKSLLFESSSPALSPVHSGRTGSSLGKIGRKASVISAKGFSIFTRTHSAGSSSISRGSSAGMQQLASTNTPMSRLPTIDFYSVLSRSCSVDRKISFDTARCDQLKFDSGLHTWLQQIATDHDIVLNFNNDIDGAHSSGSYPLSSQQRIVNSGSGSGRITYGAHGPGVTGSFNASSQQYQHSNSATHAIPSSRKITSALGDVSSKTQDLAKQLHINKVGEKSTSMAKGLFSRGRRFLKSSDK